MMIYQQPNSTFIPKTKDALAYLTTQVALEDNLAPFKEKEELLLKIKEYEDKTNELEKILKSKTQEMHSYNNLIVTLEDEIRHLKDSENKNDFTKIESLNSDIIKLQDENTKLKEELTTQKEHAQLLYVLIMILLII